MADVVTFEISAKTGAAKISVDQLGRSLKEVERVSHQVSRQIRQGQLQMQSALLASRRAASSLRVALASIGLGFGLVKAVQAMESFEASMSAVKAVSESLERDFKRDLFGDAANAAK